MKTYSKKAGFTLIELLVVIGILAVLLAIVLIAINPARQFAQANNTQRSSDVNSILNAVHQFMADNNGTPPAALTASGSGTISNTGIDICGDLVSDYLAALPVDPQTTPSTPIDEVGCTGTYTTGYTVSRSAANNRITVSAPNAELGAVISVTR
ncbi:MAG TPA: type II secretion system protein [Candidatus Woesebacteria bacterium]|nr:type II secretion system protein [Candidatus Woesebacteria bacterium]